MIGIPLSWVWRRVSERPAGAAERAPEGLVVRDWQISRPGMRVRMPVNAAAARGGAIDGGGGKDLLGALMIAAETPHRRPVGHGRRQRRRQILELAISMYGFPADQR